MPPDPPMGLRPMPQLINFPAHKHSPLRNKSCMKPWRELCAVAVLGSFIKLHVQESVHISRPLLMGLQLEMIALLEGTLRGPG